MDSAPGGARWEGGRQPSGAREAAPRGYTAGAWKHLLNK